MAGLLDLFSGRSSDIYGNGLLTPEQRGGLGNIGLLALAGKLGQLAGPSFSPVPDFGAALGQAAGAYGASQEGAGTAALNAILTAQKGRKLQQELDYYQKLGPVLGKLAGDWPRADGGAGGGEGSGSTGGGAAAPLGAGGGGGSGSASEAANLVGNFESEGLAKKLGISPYNIAYGGKDLSNAPRDENGFPQWEGKDNSHAAGRYQFQPGTWARYAKPLGITDFSPASQDRVFEAAYADKGFGHWAPYNPALASAIRTRGAAPTAAAPAGGGGLLAPTAPNPLSDAEPMVGIPRPAVAPQAAAGVPMTGEEARRRQAASDAEIKSFYPGGANYVPPVATPAATSGGGGLLAAPPAAGTDSYVTPQGPAGDVGPAGPAGPATPRAPLPTMGPAGIELPPMQGPLAAPAPVAAAPAAPGPGLLAPPGAPASAALPRVNPAYDAYLRNLGVAGALAKGAGLPDVFGPLTGALKDSPAYQAQVELAKRLGVLPLIGPEAAARAGAEKQEALKYDPLIQEQIRLRTLPYDLLTEQEKQRLQGQREKDVAGAAPQNLGPAQTVIYPPGSPGAKTYRDAAQNNQLPPNVKLNPDGSVQVTGGNTAAFGAEVGQLNAKDFFERRKVALDAGLSVAGADEARQLLDAGILTGAGSDWRLALKKAKTAFGWDDDKVANTEAFIAQRASEVGRLIKQFGSGTGLSDADRDYATGMAAGSIKLDEKSIRRILDISERASRNVIGSFNRDASQVDPSLSPYPLTVPTHDQIRQQRQQEQQQQQRASAGGLDFSKMSLPDLTAAVTRGDLTLDQRKAIDKRFRELGH